MFNNTLQINYIYVAIFICLTLFMVNIIQYKNIDRRESHMIDMFELIKKENLNSPSQMKNQSFDIFMDKLNKGEFGESSIGWLIALAVMNQYSNEDDEVKKIIRMALNNLRGYELYKFKRLAIDRYSYSYLLSEEISDCLIELENRYVDNDNVGYSKMYIYEVIFPFIRVRCV